MLKFHIIIIKFGIFTNKNSQSDTFFPKLKNTIVKIDIKSFSVYRQISQFHVQYSQKSCLYAFYYVNTIIHMASLTD